MIHWHRPLTLRHSSVTDDILPDVLFQGYPPWWTVPNYILGVQTWLQPVEHHRRKLCYEHLRSISHSKRDLLKKTHRTVEDIVDFSRWRLQKKIWSYVNSFWYVHQYKCSSHQVTEWRPRMNRRLPYSGIKPRDEPSVLNRQSPSWVSKRYAYIPSQRTCLKILYSNQVFNSQSLVVNWVSVTPAPMAVVEETPLVTVLIKLSA